MRHKNTSLEWDRIAEHRHQQIISGLDLSYHGVLVPSILSLLGLARGQRILDVGCGSGILSATLADRGASVIGVDPSREMIKIADREYGSNKRVRFHNRTIETFARNFHGPRFDAAVSNMALVT